MLAFLLVLATIAVCRGSRRDRRDSVNITTQQRQPSMVVDDKEASEKRNGGHQDDEFDTAAFTVIQQRVKVQDELEYVPISPPFIACCLFPLPSLSALDIFLSGFEATC